MSGVSVSGVATSDVGLLDLDRDQPVPLYHQIAHGIRWKLGTGALLPGQHLPPIREAARAWGVNYHTVRRAYRLLADSGIIDPRQGRGTTILDTPPIGEGSTPEAEERTGPRLVYVAECNHHQSRELAAHVEAILGVRTVPWNFELWGEPPSGAPVLGTRFHQGEMVARWPRIAHRSRFLPLRLDPALATRVAQRIHALTPDRAMVFERDHATGREQLAGIRAMLPVRLPAAVRAVDSGAAIDPADHPGALLLVAPRLWDQVRDDARRSPAVLELGHLFRPEDLTALGPLFKPSPPPTARGPRPR